VTTIAFPRSLSLNSPLFVVLVGSVEIRLQTAEEGRDLIITRRKMEGIFGAKVRGSVEEGLDSHGF